MSQFVCNLALSICRVTCLYFQSEKNVLSKLDWPNLTWVVELVLPLTPLTSEKSHEFFLPLTTLTSERRHDFFFSFLADDSVDTIDVIKKVCIFFQLFCHWRRWHHWHQKKDMNFFFSFFAVDSVECWHHWHHKKDMHSFFQLFCRWLRWHQKKDMFFFNSFAIAVVTTEKRHELKKKYCLEESLHRLT